MILVYYKANWYLKTKRLIKEFLKRIELILGLKQVSLNKRIDKTVKVH